MIWKLPKETVLSFFEDEALSRGAAIAFYAVTSVRDPVSASLQSRWERCTASDPSIA